MHGGFKKGIGRVEKANLWKCSTCCSRSTARGSAGKGIVTFETSSVEALTLKEARLTTGQKTFKFKCTMYTSGHCMP